MNIKHDILAAMEREGWKASRLAREAGVAAPIVTRIVTGERSGVCPRNLVKLWPYLYPGEPVPAPLLPTPPTATPPDAAE